TVTVHVIGGTGVLEDKVDVSATLGNCKGGIAGQDITGSGLLDGGAVLGSVTFGGPRIGVGKLAATGENGKFLLLGGAMLFGAVAVMGVRRRLRTQSSSPESS
ncbi:MAG: LPXTG cell wall anchor domain-containing protein, partial [Actinomycetota bacterium]|nr:LPXTG cell wall anchor domain-containing protein [Actinomycetota bacterium]